MPGGNVSGVRVFARYNIWEIGRMCNSDRREREEDPSHEEESG